MKKFDTVDKIFFALCALMWAIGFMLLFLTPLDWGASGMIALLIVYGIAFIMCFVRNYKLKQHKDKADSSDDKTC